MQNYLGDIIYKAREREDVTQDQYGTRYGVTGPAIFKFEKGYVRPSLELWLLMAKDAGLPEKRAVLLWVKTKLPEAYQEYVEMQGASAQPTKKTSSLAKVSTADLAKFKSRKELLSLCKAKDIPHGLLSLIEDDELWALYKPTGQEIGQLLNIFGPLGEGTTVHFREALTLLRSFQDSE